VNESGTIYIEHFQKKRFCFGVCKNPDQKEKPMCNACIQIRRKKKADLLKIIYVYKQFKA
jgi:hypothetical protein